MAVTVSIQDWEELTQTRVEQGVDRGLADIKAGRFEEIGEAAKEERLARFKMRPPEE